MMAVLREFFYKYYVVPGYDWVDTLTYGLILGFCVFYIIPKIKVLGFQIDRKFAVGLFPYIYLGATTRELVDQALGWYSGHSVFPANFYLVSPTIYLTMFLFTTFWIGVSIAISKKINIEYYKIFGFIGLLFAGYNTSLILSNISNIKVLFMIFAALTIATFITYIIVGLAKLEYVWHELNFLVILAHLIDASSTFIGVDFLGHIEQHVLPNVFIGLTGTSAVMYPLKLAVLLPALYYIDKDMADDKFGRRILKVVITILGLGPGMRNITLMLLG